MRIGVDIMGGDFAPEAVALGAILAHAELPSDVTLVLIGDSNKAKAVMQENNFNPENVEFVHTEEVIGMGEHPAKAFSQKPKASISLGFHMLAKKQLDGFTSAGNTGAMLVGAMFSVKAIPGIIRPCITAPIPKPNGKHTILLDVGLNPDSKPDVLYQYGVIGSLFAESVYGIKNPKVGLLNIGSEAEKGNLAAKATHEAMLGTKDFNFIGNVEGSDIFDEKVDVIVCDGFVGNVVLKQAEAFYKVIKKQGIKDEFFDRFNFEHQGGTPVLGVNGNVVIGHGISNDVAIKNMILHTKEVIDAKLPDRLKKYFN